MTLRVAIVGYGSAGEFFHGPLLRHEPTMSVVAVVTSHPVRIQKAMAAHPGAQIFHSFDDLLAAQHDLDLDVVVIASANSAHVTQAQQALKVGLHVVVDKPLAGNAQDAQLLVEQAQNQQRVLTVFHNRRWDSDFLTLTNEVKQGHIGEVIRLESRYERWRPVLKGGWRESGTGTELGGLLLDLGSHLVDQALHLLGPVESVHCRTKSLRDPAGPEDDFFIELEHISGATSHLSATVFAAKPGPRFRVLGTSGMLIFHGLDEQEAQLRAGLSPTAREFGAPSTTAELLIDQHHQGHPSERVVTSVTGQWATFYPQVSAAITDGAPLPVLGHEAIECLRILDAARYSAVHHQIVHMPRTSTSD